MGLCYYRGGGIRTRARGGHIGELSILLQMIRRRAAILGVLGIAVALFALISGLLLFQRSILYAPWTCSADEEASALAKYNIPPSAAVDLISKDKTIIRGYWLPMPGERANQLPTILYLHV